MKMINSKCILAIVTDFSDISQAISSTTDRNHCIDLNHEPKEYEKYIIIKI